MRSVRPHSASPCASASDRSPYPSRTSRSPVVPGLLGVTSGSLLPEGVQEGQWPVMSSVIRAVPRPRVEQMWSCSYRARRGSGVSLQPGPAEHDVVPRVLLGAVLQPAQPAFHGSTVASRRRSARREVVSRLEQGSGSDRDEPFESVKEISPIMLLTYTSATLSRTAFSRP
jgi:hypothetical protein